MMIDLVLADPKDAKKVGTDFHHPDFEYLEMPGIANWDYVELYALLLGKRPSKKLAKEFRLLWGDPDLEVDVYELPNEFVVLLAALKDKSIAQLTDQWRESAEGRVQRQPEVAPDAIERLRKMSKLAIKRKTSLLVRETP